MSAPMANRTIVSPIRRQSLPYAEFTALMVTALIYVEDHLIERPLFLQGKRCMALMRRLLCPCPILHLRYSAYQPVHARTQAHHFSSFRVSSDSPSISGASESSAGQTSLCVSSVGALVLPLFSLPASPSHLWRCLVFPDREWQSVMASSQSLSLSMMSWRPMSLYARLPTRACAPLAILIVPVIRLDLCIPALHF